MKITKGRFWVVAAALLLASTSLFAQNGDRKAPTVSKYLISAKAGGVNFVEGPVAIVRKTGQSGSLIKGDQVNVGDRVSTGAIGRAEILLNPGSFVRLGENSAFEFQNTSLADLRLRLDSGTAILEIFATKDFTVTVQVQRSKFKLYESGIYRIDVPNNGVARLEVTKGRALAGTEVVKSGRAAVMNGSVATIEKFDKGDKDALESWSKSRAKELAKVTARLDRTNMRSSMLNSYMHRWNMYDSFGVWVYDPFYHGATFLPFGYGWGSPYGYWYGTSIWNLGLPRYVMLPPTGYYTVTGPTPTANPGAAPIRDTKPGSVGGGDAPMVRPAYTSIQGTSNSTGSGVMPTRRDRGFDVSDGLPTRSAPSFPSSMPAPMSAPSMPAPAPAPVMDRKPGRP